MNYKLTDLYGPAWRCPKCGTLWPWSNWGMCPVCKEKTGD